MESGLGDGSGFSAMNYYESLIATTDVELLKRVWRNEKAAPEILPFANPFGSEIQRTDPIVDGLGQDSLSVEIIPSDSSTKVPEPQLGSFVICRIKNFMGAIQLDDKQFVYF